jgi:hypothetical protein
MIETIETTLPGVVGLKFSGTLHDEDYKQFLPRIETLLTAQGKVRLFIQFEDFHGWDLHAAWDDLKFSLKHYSDFERIALVGDRKWEHWMANFSKPFTWAQVRYFDTSEVDAAWKWLEEEDSRKKVAKPADQASDGSEEPDSWGNYHWYWS